MSGFQNAQGFPAVPPGVLQATPGLGGADAGPAINSQLSATGLVILPAKTTTTIQTTINPVDDCAIIGLPGSVLKWTGANSSTIFQQLTSGTPNMRNYIGGWASALQIDPGTATGLNIFDLHSPQHCVFRQLSILGATDQTATVFKIRCDVTTAGGYGVNKNAIDNIIGEIHCGKNGTFLDMAGALATSQVVTLNNFYAIDALNIGTAYITVGDFFDNNAWWGINRSSLNQNNAVGADYGGTANVYANYMQGLQPDTFAGKTGRIGLRFQALSSRNQVTSYFNNPAAETPLSALGDGWDVYVGDYGEAGVPSSGMSSTFRRRTNVTSLRTLTYSASMTPDVTLTNVDGTYTIAVTDGVAMAINAPAGPGTADKIRFRFLNSSGGAMGVITWNAVFKVAGGATGFAGPANGKYKYIAFEYDGTNWVESFRSAADIG